MSTARQVAEKIVIDWLKGENDDDYVEADAAIFYPALQAAIESALLAQIEECAKVADNLPSNYGIYVSREEVVTAIRSLSNRGRG